MGSCVQKFLVIDDHPLVRAGFKALLFEVVGSDRDLLEAGTMEQALAVLANESDVNLVILDVNLPDSSGLGGLTTIKEKFPAVRVALISEEADLDVALHAFQEGAIGLIPKGCDHVMTQNALRVMLSGGGFFPPEVFEHGNIHSISRTPKNFSGVPKKETIAMAPRQYDILGLMLEGYSNKEIARKLGIALGTVKNQVAVILRVLNAQNRSQAVMNAIKAGIVDERLQLTAKVS